MSAVAGLFCLPILIWNMQNDWVTFRHVDQPAPATGLPLAGPLDYLGGQAALLLGYWFVVWLAAMIAYRPAGASRRRRALPVVAVGADVPGVPALQLQDGRRRAELAGDGLPVRPGAGGGWLGRQLASPSALLSAGLHGGRGRGVRPGSGGDGGDAPHRLGPSAAGAAVRPGDGRSADAAAPLRPDLPAARLALLWRQRWTSVREQLRAEEGAEPVLAARAGRCPASWASTAPAIRRPIRWAWRWATATASTICGRTRCDDAEAFRGRTFIVVGWVSEDARKAFDAVEEPRDVVYHEDGRPIASWTITVCRGYRGFRGDADGRVVLTQWRAAGVSRLVQPAHPA